ncbi:hypothetical protein FNV43_RR20581 [Rhamnella rubrinervis]|uniref:Uncharacterized protein n=1 Tax=Rhamnella rubrinervis TaxID=2594499 RepID=A0A8K0DV28_9ROSA|nr:hypothetical protein FNV43_RR20581 [Rhamnella rubrinervis]
MSLSSLTTLHSYPLFTDRSRAFGTHLRPGLLSRPSNVVVCSVIPSSASALSVAQSASQGLSRIESLSQVSGVLGCQWGDEGNGTRRRLGLALRYCCSLPEGKKFVLHLVPSGILNDDNLCVTGGLFKEIDGLDSSGVSCKGRILISDREHLC